MLVTNYCGNPRLIYSVDSTGAVSVFSTLPSRDGGCEEDYLAISPGLGGFPANHIYVMQGPNIVEVGPTGLVVGVLATIPSLPGTHNGITFDHLGLYGFDMIVTGSNGQVWRVNSSGTATFLASVGTIIEGPDIAPLSFVPYGGQILAASEAASAVYAISPTGMVSFVISWPSAEHMRVIPPNPCNFGSSGGTFFDVIYPLAVYKTPSTDFTGLGGDVLVTSEFSGSVGLLQSTGGTITSTTFQSGLGQQEGSAIVDCAVPPIQGIKVSKFFTDTSNNLLPLDKNGNPMVNVVLSNGVVKSTNPGEIIAWVNVTDTSGVFQSLKLNETLPVDWIVAPTWDPAKGAIHVYYANTTSLATNPEITQPSTLSVSTGNPEVVHLSIPSLNNTAIGHPLMPGQTILLAVKLDYGLDMTSQSASSYPRNYTDTASAAAWTKESYTGDESTGTASAFFIAYAKVVGDVDNDGHVDITDLAIVGASFGSTVGNPNYNPAADLTNKGSVDIADLAIVAAHFGS